MISSQSLISLFQQALKENWGYIWGTAGEKWTAALQKELEKTTDSDRALGRKYGKKWIGHTVADCSGLFSWAFRRLGGYMYHGSDTMYRKYCADKGELVRGRRSDGGALKPGTAVFVWNGKSYSHVGLFVGNNTVIEAMGTINGVTTTKVTAGKWTHWGELTGVEYNSELRIQNSELKETGMQAIGRGSKGEAVREMQAMLERLGYDLGVYGVDGDFGKDTEAAVKRFQADHGLAADGICGPATYAALEQALASPQKQARCTVTVSGLDRRTAEEIAGKYGGTVTEE